MRTAALLAGVAVALVVPAARGQEPAPVPAVPPTSAPWAVEVPPQPVLGDGTELGGDPRLWLEADYILYWLKPVCLKPPTLLADNEIVQGNHKFQFNGASGVRPRVGYWFTDDHFLGMEIEGFVLQQVSASQPFSATGGSPASFITFQNPDNSPGTMPFSIPGVVGASSSAVGSSQLWGLESNFSSRFDGVRGGWGLHSTFLAGCRYLQIDDRVVLTNRQTLLSDPQVTAVGQANFGTQNQFIGGQVGSRLGVTRGPLGLDLTTKVAVGDAHLVSNISGNPLVSGGSVQSPLLPGPFLALPSNVGQSSTDRIAVVPEVNLRLRWQFRDNVALTLGYNILYWNRVLCPGDQMDPHVNTTQLPLHGPVTGPLAPVHQFVFTDAFAHGFEAGLGFSF